MTSKNEIKLLPDQKVDELHIPGLQIIQSKNSFMYGIDGILLSDFAKVKCNEEVVEL